jgi:hypothetical protein
VSVWFLTLALVDEDGDNQLFFGDSSWMDRAACASSGALRFVDLRERLRRQVETWRTSMTQRYRVIEPEVRFWMRVEKDPQPGCWWWTGTLNRRYGVFSVRGKNIGAHRFAYEKLVGPIPEGLFLDHLCMNPTCVNPSHLEPVAPGENTLRWLRYLRANPRTHCYKGHVRNEKNTRWREDHQCYECRVCANAAKRRWEAKKRDERA